MIASKEIPPERRGVSRSRVIEAAKELVPVIDLADLLTGPCGMRKRGEEWIGRCPLPDHEDKTPSFAVNKRKNLWYCHGCVRGGDVVNLAAAAWEYGKHEQAMAAALLLERFGHDIPRPPDSFFAKNARQAPVRDAIRRQKIEVLRRRLFRIVMLPLIEEWTDAENFRAERDAAWKDFQSVPVEALLNRLEDEGRG